MVAVDLKGIHTVKSNGRCYYYAWRGGPRIMGEPGTPGFVACFNEAIKSASAEDDKKLKAWVTLYLASDDWKDNAESTKKNWRPHLDAIRDGLGDLSLRLFERPEIRIDIKKWRDEKAATPRTAQYRMQVLSAVFKFVVDQGALKANPCTGIISVYSGGNRAELIWTEADLNRFYAEASNEVRCAVKLAVMTGMRKGDLLTMPWSAVKPNCIDFIAHKSISKKGMVKERRVLIPLYAALRGLLAEIPRRSPVILTQSQGAPWTNINASFDPAREKAGLGITEARKALHFHDLRGTAATRLFVTGFKPDEIAEMMGWSVAEVERLIKIYVKSDEILLARIRRLDANQAGTDEQPKTEQTL